MGSSRARARTCVPCIGRWILNHCATREVPNGQFYNVKKEEMSEETVCTAWRDKKMENIKERVGDLEDTVRRCSIHLIRALKEKRRMGHTQHLKRLWLALDLMKDTNS